MVNVRILRVDGSDSTIPLPVYQSQNSSGCDLHANLKLEQQKSGIIIPKTSWQLVPTGLAIVLPEGFEAQIRSRSGLALYHGITVMNSPGTIDSDYRGEVGVILLNQGTDDYLINHGDRIAQLVIAQTSQVKWATINELPHTERGENGFGSTGRD
ncbi:MAG: dUTP diphosphatase [Rhodobacteraceae bacterium]|nr:dUTP diphosphatase [Paracoccaceae bacterium]